MAIHNKQKQHNEPMRTRSKAKRGKTRVTKSRLFLVLQLIGWVGGASFLNQSESVVKQNQRNSAITFDSQLKTPLSFESNFLL